MVRTRADGAGSKAVGAKAPRKNFGGSSSSGSTSASPSPSGKSRYSGGNPACPRPVPEWQKGIQHFFTNKENHPPNESRENDKEGQSSSQDANGAAAEDAPENASLARGSSTQDTSLEDTTRDTTEKESPVQDTNDGED